MKRFLVALSAGAISTTLLVGAAAVAQEQTADAVMAGMSELGIDVEGLALTGHQVLQVQTILNGAEGDADKVAQINQLLGL